MNPVEFHPFEMQFEVPGTAAPDHLRLRLCGAIALPLCLPVGI